MSDVNMGPVRCFTCGNPLSILSQQYADLLKNERISPMAHGAPMAQEDGEKKDMETKDAR